MGDDGRTEKPHRLPSNSRMLERQGEEVPLAEASLVTWAARGTRLLSKMLPKAGERGRRQHPCFSPPSFSQFSISASHWPTFLEARDQVSLEMQFSKIQSKAGEEWGTDLMANKAWLVQGQSPKELMSEFYWTFKELLIPTIHKLCRNRVEDEIFQINSKK